MSDLAVKLFMVENDLHDFESARNVMYRYGLAEQYEDIASKLEALGSDDSSEEAAFIDGAEFIGDVVDKIKFAVGGEYGDYNEIEHAFFRGIDTAADSIKQIVAKAVEAARGNVDDQPSPVGIDKDALTELFSAIFGEQTSR